MEHTQCTIYSNGNIRLYTDYLDDSWMFIEIISDTVNTTVKFPMIDFVSMAAYFDLDLLERQSKVTDEEILKFAEHEVYQRSEDSSIYALWGLGLYGASSLPREEQIDNGFKHFAVKRSEIKQIVNNIKKIKPRTVHFGLEGIVESLKNITINQK